MGMILHGPQKAGDVLRSYEIMVATVRFKTHRMCSGLPREFEEEAFPRADVEDGFAGEADLLVEPLRDIEKTRSHSGPCGVVGSGGVDAGPVGGDFMRGSPFGDIAEAAPHADADAGLDLGAIG